MIGPAMAAAGQTLRQLMVDADVWAKETTADGAGGQTVDWVDQDRTVPVHIVKPTATERETAAQQGVEITHTAVMPVDVNVSRGIRLVIDGTAWELTSDPLVATHPSVSRAMAKQEPWDEPTA